MAPPCPEPARANPKRYIRKTKIKNWQSLRNRLPPNGHKRLPFGMASTPKFVVSLFFFFLKPLILIAPIAFWDTWV